MVLALSAQLEDHERRLARVQHIMEQLLAWRFGSRRERVVDERQLFLFAVEFEAQGGDISQLMKELVPPEEAAENPLLALEEEAPRKKKGHGRKPLPSALKRERIEYDLSEAERTCPKCSQPMVKIGEDVSERLEYVPASLKVIEEARAKYGCRCGGCIKTAPKPSSPIAKSTAGPSLLAQVAVSKYLDYVGFPVM
jgi:transposase